ncbi:MAG: PEPxxWA-CTERM sorting domain-containing protein, partial [Polymorphobacter sp.]
PRPTAWDLDNVSVTAVPEPASWALLIGGFGLVGSALRRARKRAATA